MTRLNFKLVILLLLFSGTHAQRTVKPVLHGRHWMAITGKPLGATAGATIFSQGGNAVDAACAMLAATATMFDVLSWGGETQALIYNPKTKKVIGVNALGVAPTGATPEFYKQKDLKYPPQFGPLSAVTPGTPGGLMVMLAEYGSMSLAQVLKPCMEMAEGYPIEAQAANSIERHKKRIKEWPYSKNVFLVHHGEKREAPSAGEVFKQLDLLATLQKLVDAEAKALKKGKSRKNAIYDAYDRFYKGDIAKEFVRSTQEQGGLITMNDLANWQVYLEEPVTTNYKGIDVYKLTTWVQGPVMLQALNMIELFDLKAMGYNSSRYIHTLYQAMNHAFADRDFYYGDPYFPPEEPVKGLLSKEYAAARVKQMNLVKNDPDVKPGDPYKFMSGKNPYLDLLETWGEEEEEEEISDALYGFDDLEKEFFTGTTSIQTTDTDGWVVSITPSGGWIPTVIAGKTGIGLSQRGQSFVLSEEENPYNVIAPGKRPRATLTPAMALKNGKPYLSFAVQGGDTQDQNLLQFFLNIVEFDMNIQEASEAANINSYQMYSSFGDHNKETGRLIVQEQTPPWVMKELKEMGYKVQKRAITSGPINAIYFDWEHGSFWGGSSHHGEDYGIAW